MSTTVPNQAALQFEVATNLGALVAVEPRPPDEPKIGIALANFERFEASLDAAYERHWVQRTNAFQRALVQHP